MAAEFNMTRRVQFAETDQAGVMHFANYFRIMEETEHAFWRSVGHSVHVRDDDKEIGWPRVRASCEYFAPARFEDVLELRLRVTEVTATKFSYELDFVREGHVLAKGRTTAVCCSIENASFTPVRIPDHLRARLEELLNTA